MLKSTILALAAFAAAPSLAAEGKLPRAVLAASKELSAPETKDVLVQGRPFQVTYSIVNTGEDTAFDVVLTDNFPEEYFDIISGTPSMKFAELAPNENQTSVVVLKPKVSGVMTVARAELEYKFRPTGASSEDAEEAELVDARAVSSTPNRVEIFKVDVYERFASTHAIQVIIAFAAAAGLIVGPYSVYKTAAAANDGAIKKQ